MHFRRGKTAERYPQGREFDKDAVEGNAFCEKCHAVHYNKRWYYDESLFARLSTQADAQAVTCPGCRAIQQRRVDGIVTLSGPFVAEHKDEILSLLRHEEAAEREKNPLCRIVNIESSGGQVDVHTTTEFLATRLGRAIESAYQGKLEIDPVQYSKFTRVRWKRDD